MAAPIYSNRKGIYKDLYREIDSNNKKREVSQAPRTRKGIYKNLYRQFEDDKIAVNSENNKNDSLHKLPLKAFAYTSNIGEALKPIIGKLFVKLSLVPSLIYAILAILTNQSKTQEPQNKSKNITKESLFQLFASFLLPDMVVKSTRRLTNKFIDRISTKTKQKDRYSIISRASGNYRNIILSTMGLVSFALAVKPIDIFVENSLDRLYGQKGRI